MTFKSELLIKNVSKPAKSHQSTIAKRKMGFLG